MERYTRRQAETWALAEGAELSQALDRLGRCEDLLSDLEREQTELSQKLEELRFQGKNKTVQFKESTVGRRTASRAAPPSVRHHAGRGVRLFPEKPDPPSGTEGPAGLCLRGDGGRFGVVPAHPGHGPV